MGGPHRETKPQERKAPVAVRSGTREPEPAAGVPHPVLEAQKTIGNRAVARRLGGSPAPGSVQRSPAPGGPAPGGGGGGRVVLIDANVIGEINRGNAQAAEALLALRRSAKVYISRQAYNELTAQPGKMIAGVGPDLPRTAAANRLLLQELGIEIGPSGAAADRIPVHETNIVKMKGNISPQDLAHVAQAKAIGAELWSLDRAFRKQVGMIEKQLGIKIAPETLSVPLSGGRTEDYRVARRLVGLEPVEITVGGRVKRTPPAPPASPTPTGAPPAPKAPAPKASAPPALAARAGRVSEAALAAAREAAQSTTRDLKMLKASRMLRNAVQVLQGVVAFHTLNKFLGMAESKLSGGGFLLHSEIRRADRLRDAARSLEAGYKPFSESIQALNLSLFQAAADPLSAGQVASRLADLHEQLADLRRHAGERIGSLEGTLRLVRARRQYALSILNSQAASSALVAATFGTAELAEIFAASEDLSQIESALDAALASFRGVAESLDADVEFLKSWDESLFEVCERGGYCGSRRLSFLFLGESHVRIFPGE